MRSRPSRSSSRQATSRRGRSSPRSSTSPTRARAAQALPWDAGAALRGRASYARARRRCARAPRRERQELVSSATRASTCRGPIALARRARRTSRRSRPSRRRGATWSTSARRGTSASRRPIRICAFAKQEIVLTVPASFDASARDLTVEAAVAAGIEDVTLLEEPQAALYAWIEARGRRLAQGDQGRRRDPWWSTSAAAPPTSRPSGPRWRRTARWSSCADRGRRPHPPGRRQQPDLALAHVVRQKLVAEGKEVDRLVQMSALTQACRVAKERLLGDPDVARGSAPDRGRGAAAPSSSAAASAPS